MSGPGPRNPQARERSGRTVPADLRYTHAHPHCQIKCDKPRPWYNLYGDGGFAHLISTGSKLTRKRKTQS
eukprot:2649033-Rhodomonas_salina.1